VTLARPLYLAAMPGARLRAEVHDLAVTLRDARNRAISGSRETFIRIEPDAARYVADNERAVELSSGTAVDAMPFAGSDTGRRRRLDPTDEPYVVTFYPDGSSSGATIEIGNRSGRFRVEVDWLTGRVTAGEAGDDAS